MGYKERKRTANASWKAFDPLGVLDDGKSANDRESKGRPEEGGRRISLRGTGYISLVNILSSFVL